MYPRLNRVCRPFVAMLALLAMSPLLVAVPQEFSTKLNVPSKDVHVEGTLWLPSDINQVRCVIITLNFNQGEQLYREPEWRDLAKRTACGLLLTTISSTVGDSPLPRADPIRNAGVGGEAGLLLLLNRLAVESRHDEVRNAPLLFWGHSAAASFGISFAGLHPDRTIGFVRYHGNLRGQPVNIRSVSNIPALLLAGEKDSVAGIEDTRDLWKAGRQADAPWTFAIQAGEAHTSTEGFRKANALMISWVEAVVRQRVAKPRLRGVKRESGWLGDNRSRAVVPYSSSHRADGDTSWLPDETTARAWKALSAEMGDRINDALAPRKSYPERKVIELPTSVLGRYAGVYQLPSNANLAIVVNDRRIRIAADNPLAPHFT